MRKKWAARLRRAYGRDYPGLDDSLSRLDRFGRRRRVAPPDLGALAEELGRILEPVRSPLARMQIVTGSQALGMVVHVARRGASRRTDSVVVRLAPDGASSALGRTPLVVAEAALEEAEAAAGGSRGELALALAWSPLLAACLKAGGACDGGAFALPGARGLFTGSCRVAVYDLGCPLEQADLPFFAEPDPREPSRVAMAELVVGRYRAEAALAPAEAEVFRRFVSRSAESMDLLAGLCVGGAAPVGWHDGDVRALFDSAAAARLRAEVDGLRKMPGWPVADGPWPGGARCAM
jgi:hypothetical protein